MRTMAAHYVHRGLRNLRRSPALIAVMAFSIAFGMAALLAAFAWWRVTSGHPIWRNAEPLYVVQTAPHIPRGGDALGPVANDDNRCGVLRASATNQLERGLP